LTIDTKNQKPSKILIVSHGHPDETPGGGEICAFESFQTFRTFQDIEARFLFARDAVPRYTAVPVCIDRFKGREDEYYFPVSAETPFHTSYRFFDDSRSFDEQFEREIIAFLQNYNPNVVHFHHYYRVGLELISLARKALPQAVICLTLHDYKAICPWNGHMVRRHEERSPGGIKQLCSEASLQRCMQCCDDRTVEELLTREAFVRSSLRNVDLFFAPSTYLKQRYLDWGLPTNKIVYLENGRKYSSPSKYPVLHSAQKFNRFAFFGRPTKLKGLDTFLQAISILATQSFTAAKFFINSSELNEQKELIDLIQSTVKGCKCEVNVLGAYRPDELVARMELVDWVVVPSIWWENSPLVIQEAFIHGRPVICSNVGGMAEKVKHNINGLHFEVGNAAALAEAINAVCFDAELWNRLSKQVPKIESVESSCSAMLNWYQVLWGNRQISMT